jgi:Domain of unknown function (DUF4157)/Agrobacterium VirD5 protein
MTPSSGPITAARPGVPSRVIQGHFPGGRPNILRPSSALATSVRPQGPAAPMQARPASPPVPIVPGRPAATGALQPALRPGQPRLPILPTPVRPGALVPAMPPRPQMPPPILAQTSRPAIVQPQGGSAFALPANFTLRPRGSGQPLPEPIQKKMESFFNTSFADVRVHVGHEAASIGALAFTHGTDLYFAPGQYNPQSTLGQQLLGHELTHVVQQRAGRVRNPLGAGVAVVQDPALEAEAERMGLRAASAAVPIQAKPAGAGTELATSLAAGPRPNSITVTGATQPARAPDHSSAPPTTGPLSPGKQLAPARTGVASVSPVSLNARAPVAQTMMAVASSGGYGGGGGFGGGSGSGGGGGSVIRVLKCRVCKTPLLNPKKPCPNCKGKYSLAAHGAKTKTQKFLGETYGKKVSGATHESEHPYGYDVLSGDIPGKRGKKPELRKIENEAPAYQEVKDLHRSHIGTGTTLKPGRSGINSIEYREWQRQALSDHNPDIAMATNQMDYAFMDHSKIDKIEAQQANESYAMSVRGMGPIPVGINNQVAYYPAPTDEQKLNMLFYQWARTHGRYPNEQEEMQIAAENGLGEAWFKLGS